MPAVSPSLQPLVLDELARVCDSESLRRSQALVRLLRYLVEHHVAGDGNALRETAIALDVFRRDPSTYDPQGDPIVRVTTGRLRERLTEHYAQRGKTPTLTIVLPRGRYVPEYVVAAKAAAPRIGVAVLRTRNATGDAAHEAFCAGLAERLADHLARAGIQRVIARASVDGATQRDHEPEALAESLDVAWILDSAVAIVGADEGHPAVRISARLQSAVDGALRWTESRSGSAAQRHAMADRLIDAVVLRACDTLPGDPTRTHVPVTTAMPSAHRNAIDAARLLLLQRTITATDEAVALAERAVAACPEASEAWAALASALYSRLTFQDRRPEPLAARTREAAERALALDPVDPVALRTKAIIVGRYEWNFTEAAGLYERALRAMPHYTSARLNYSDLLLVLGEFERALAEANLALVYDPLSSSVRLARALVLTAHGRFDEARAEWSILRASGESSFWVYTGPARLEVTAGRIDVAQAWADEGLARFPDVPEALFCTAFVAAARGHAALARDIDETIMRRFPHFSPTHRAALPAMLRDKRGVLKGLDEALATRDIGLLYAAIAPEFAWLADDVDFLARLRRCGIHGWRGRVAILATVD